SEAERHQLLIEWNQTAAEYPRTQCLHELFEQQAAKTPERLAVRCGEQGFSYRTLNEAANQLAHYLRKHGVGPDRPVGLCLDRSADTMIAVLAILKAGGAYVPLNADNPPGRLELERYPEGLQFATVSTLGADLGNTCIYPSLIAGGTLHIVSYEMATDPRGFADYVAKYPIDVLKIVPSHLQALLQSDEAQK